MTTMRTLLTRSIRLTRAVALGATPEADEMAAALEDAQALFLQLTNRQLTDVLISADYTAGEDERITYLSGTPTVTRPTSITAEGVTRPPRNGAIIEVAATTRTRHIYVSENKSWNAVTDLTLESDQPFGETSDEDLAGMIALRICDSVFQQDPTQMLAERGAMSRLSFQARFAQPINAVADPGLLPRRYATSIDEE